MSAPQPELVGLILQPQRAEAMRPEGWDAVVRQARASGLLARLYRALERGGCIQAVPPNVLRHMESARVLTDRHAEMVAWEAQEIGHVLEPVTARVVLLKGAAYTVSGLPPADGRLFSDIDVLVPRQDLAAAEHRLGLHGWVSAKLDAYDQRYYRRWMHELPPLHHARRGTTLDLHHNILPETSRFGPPASALLADVRPVPEYPPLHVLSPEDMTLHCAAHMLCEGEMAQGLRDLLDLRDLVVTFSEQPEFWPRLTRRALTLDLARPLLYGLAAAERLLELEVPPAVCAALRTAEPPAPVRALMSRLLDNALRPDHRTCRLPAEPLARWLLYVRGHYLRMPLRLLLPHLARKATRGQRQHA